MMQMVALLDGEGVFGEGQPVIEAGSIGRNSIERTVGGLDGVLSIDLAGRGREIRQKGVLRARSKAEMRRKVEAVSAFLDGDAHTLASGSGEEFEDVRMDSFKVTNERVSGGGVEVDYEVVYRQLV
jgi:hypothetical protein